MSKRKRNIIQIKRKISECKKRLDSLKNQGFNFSPEIYNDLNTLKENRKPYRSELWDGKTAQRCLDAILNYKEL